VLGEKVHQHHAAEHRDHALDVHGGSYRRN
jgi:hypothetical protein